MELDRFAQRLQKAMQDAGLKQVDLVRLAQDEGRKLGKSQVSQYVSGKTLPRPDMLNFLAKALNVDEAWLGGSGEASKTAADVSARDGAVGASDSIDNSATVEGADKSGRTASSSDELVEVELTATSLAEALMARPRIEYGEEDAGDQSLTSAIARPRSASSSITATFSVPMTPSPLSASHSAAETNEATQSETAQKGSAVKYIKKSSKLDNVLYDVRGPVVAEAARMEAEGTHVLKLNIGNPAPFGFRTPDEVVYDLSRQLTECEGYSDSKGLFAARKAIMQYAQIKRLPNVTMDGIYTGNGVSELINLCMQALLDSGDEILIPSPDYPLWTATATLAGGVPVHYICDEQAEWYPDMDDIRSKITPRTKAIVIINPNNPTGALYPVEVLQEIVDIAREHGLMIFSDEIYDRLVMDGLEHTSIASLCPDLFCITFSGLSKSHMIAGYRIGWMVLSGNKRLAADYIEGLDMLSNMRLCSNVPAQSIVQTALWGYQSVKDYVVPGGRIYEQRNFVHEALESIPGITCVKPKASFYAFPKIDIKRFNITDDVQFALDLLRDKKLLIVQGTGFNWGQPDHFRVVYLPRVEVLGDAMNRLEGFLRYYRQ